MSNLEDTWNNRSAGMRCITCIWYVPKIIDNTIASQIGRCRRHAPTMGGYPVCKERDWCGDHRLDETKVTPTV